MKRIVFVLMLIIIMISPATVYATDYLVNNGRATVTFYERAWDSFTPSNYGKLKDTEEAKVLDDMFSSGFNIVAFHKGGDCYAAITVKDHETDDLYSNFSAVSNDDLIDAFDDGYSTDIVNANGYKYVRIKDYIDSADYSGDVIQYITVVDGTYYALTAWDLSETGFTSITLSDLEIVAKGIKYSAPPVAEIDNTIQPILLIIGVLIILAIICIAFIIVKRRNQNKNINKQQAEHKQFENDSKTLQTQKQKKDISNCASTSNRIPVDELKALNELLHLGAITQEEFDQKKKQLLNL